MKIRMYYGKILLCKCIKIDIDRKNSKNKYIVYSKVFKVNFVLKYIILIINF